MLLPPEFTRGKIDPEGVWEASGEAGWIKRLFLRNEANKLFEINRGVVWQGETKPLNAKNKTANWSHETEVRSRKSEPRLP